jgi:hypothetical protein
VSDRATLAMAAIGGAVATGMAVSPRAFLRPFGVPPEEVTGAGALGWRLFAARTGYLSARAAAGDASAREAFLPIQLLDQAVFWHAFATRSVPRRTAVLAAATSGAIVALDSIRRRAAA